LLLATGELAASRSVSAQARPRSGAYAALIAGVFCISFTAIFTKIANVPGPVAAAYRMTIAAAVLTIPFAWHIRRTGPPRVGMRWGVFGGIWFALNLGLLSSALLRTSAATATLLDNTAPIWVGLGALIFFHEKLGRRYWAGVALALAGAAVVTGFRLSAGAGLNTGDVMAFIGAIFYAGYLLNTQRARRDLDSLTYLWLVAVTAGVALIAFCLITGLPLRGYSLPTYLILIALGVITQVGGWLLIIYALGHLPASAAVVVLLAQPVVTGLLSIPLLGETLGIRQVIGGALLLTGIALCLWDSNRGQAAEHPAPAELANDTPAT
jgi:drug/metabolite transporter (DMT)-like permease